MCANPEMQRLLMQELKDELAARKRVRASGRDDKAPAGDWRPAAFGAGVSCAALVLIAALAL